MSNNKFDKDFLYYLRDISYIPEPKWWMKLEFIKPTFEYFAFTRQMIVHILLSVLTDLTLPLSQPFNFGIMVASIIIVIAFLFPLNLFLKLIKFIDYHHFPKYFNDDWKKMLAKETESIEDIVRNGRHALGLPVSNTRGPKIFDLNMAETLLILSTIIYEQDTEKIREIYYKLKHNSKWDKRELEEDCRKAYRYVLEQANNFEMKFRPLSELDNLDSLFAGMFWSEKENFIVVTFKGTTPTNFTEWLADFLFIREDASHFVYGGIHKGFYGNFFPKALDENKISYPALRMVEIIRLKAREIHRNKNKKVNIWVTGHSLGAALAQVFYARLIKSNDLPDYCVLRDAFIFAGPAVGDKDFAFSFNGTMNQKYGEQKNLWRIVNTNDIVPRVPPSYLFDIFRRYILKNDILNYFKIGEEIHLYLDSYKEPEGIILREKMELDREIDEELNYYDLEKKLKEDNDAHISSDAERIYKTYDSEAGLDRIYNNESYIPSFLRNHLPHRYFIAMERLKSQDIVPMTGFL